MNIFAFISSQPKTSSKVNGGFELFSYRFFPKRCIDLIGCLVLAPIVLPVIFVLWVCARSDGGPGFFAHERVGCDGRVFKCVKIRSMRIDSSRLLAEHLAANPDAKAEWDRDQKLKADPRITAFGHFIRKTSLDELPQLLNVLMGDMSFVGPRPVTETELGRYGKSTAYYLALKPGITGIWQTSGRNNISYDERVSMDVSYYNNISFSLDIWLIMKTIKSVIAKEGV